MRTIATESALHLRRRFFRGLPKKTAVVMTVGSRGADRGAVGQERHLVWRSERQFMTGR